MTTTDTFVVTIVDPCDPPDVTFPVVSGDLCYTISDTIANFLDVINSFTVSPSFCTKSVTFSTSDADLQGKLSLNGD